jgi:hypothetical protein
MTQMPHFQPAPRHGFLHVLFRFRICLAGLFFLYATTGCLEIREEITFKKNFSGQLDYTFDLTRLKDVLGLLGGTGQAPEASGLLGGLNTGLKAQADKLRNMQGISRVAFTADDKNLVYRLSFRFKNLDALNGALSEYNQATNGSRFELSADRKTLTKYVGLPSGGRFQELKEQLASSDSARQMFDMMKIFMKEAQFVSSWKFARPVVGQAVNLGSSKAEDRNFRASIPLLRLLEADKDIRISATVK